MITAIIAALFIAGTNTNMLTNPGFENPILIVSQDGTTRTGTAEGWHYKITGQTYIRPDAGGGAIYGPSGPLDVADGANSCYIGTLTGGTATLWQDISVDSQSDYTASCQIKTYDAAGQGFGTKKDDLVTLRVTDITKDSPQVLAERSISEANNQYHPVSLHLKTGKSTKKVRFEIRCKVGCNHWHGCVKLDSCSLQKD